MNQRRRPRRKLPKRKIRKSPEHQEDISPAVAAARDYSEHNKDIALAVEVMRQAQLIQETRAKYLLDSLTYRVIGV
jgi:hypothetical protein